MKIQDINFEDNSIGMMVLKNLALVIHTNIEEWFKNNEELPEKQYQFIIKASIKEFADIVGK